MFYDTFRFLCKEKGVSCNKAALDIGLSNATPTTWKKRGLTPKGETLAKIADYFGVSVGYLLGTENKEKKPTPVAEDGRESEFIRLFSRLTEDEQTLVVSQIKGILSSR